MARRNIAAGIGILACWGAIATLVLWGPPVAAPRVASSTLAPAYRPGDHVWLLRWPRPFWVPDIGDVVVFAAPKGAGDRQGEGFIKRVAGLPGQRVAVREGVLFVDGEAHPEPWRNLEHGTGPDFPEALVPDDHLFLLGDDRARSYDGRHWGWQRIDGIDGVAFNPR